MTTPHLSLSHGDACDIAEQRIDTLTAALRKIAERSRFDEKTPNGQRPHLTWEARVAQEALDD